MAVVLLVSIVQSVQLSGLNEKVGQQNTLMVSLVSSGSTGGIASQAGAPAQNPVPTQTNQAPSQQMVGGC
ncbi:MAG: hypothetical protein HY544_02160 [Candidatus Diapherotrites archaeon]|uniref:Uncharacterized protein n=1 Tax=Candidatus Iainarchaeum sp. TaxID=3101447 RepID=A0A8T3YQ52_9ARCH|nr:hypothetical protein [Candidatus Diapherotrites archaeon]